MTDETCREAQSERDREEEREEERVQDINRESQKEREREREFEQEVSILQDNEKEKRIRTTKLKVMFPGDNKSRAVGAIFRKHAATHVSFQRHPLHSLFTHNWRAWGGGL